MRSAALVIACFLTIGRGVPAAEVTIAGEELLQSARMWESRQRGDLARLALEKLVTTRPDSPYALLELGELNLRMSNFAAADQVLRRLEQRFPNSAVTRSMSLQYRLATRDRLQWLSVQRMAQLGKGEEVRGELQRLFPDGAPEGPIAIDYYRLLAITPGGHHEALHGMQALAAKHPDDPRYQDALRNLQPVAAASPPPRQAAARPRPAVRQPISEPVVTVNPEAIAAAADWEKRSRAATSAQQLQLASLQLQASTALRVGDIEALIGIADRLDSSGFASQAGELLATGSALEPASNWLLETRVRYLIAHDGAEEALKLIDARPVDDQWPRSKRDDLRASALAARARMAETVSNEDAAIADLTEAITLQPTDPWTRHRLASLLARRDQKEQGREVMNAGATAASNGDPICRELRCPQASRAGRSRAACCPTGECAIPSAASAGAQSCKPDRIPMPAFTENGIRSPEPYVTASSPASMCSTIASSERGQPRTGSSTPSRMRALPWVSRSTTGSSITTCRTTRLAVAAITARNRM